LPYRLKRERDERRRIRAKAITERLCRRRFSATFWRIRPISAKIRAKKARYYEDRRLQERNLPLPSLTDSVKESPKVRHHDWSAQPPIALDLKLATGGASDEVPDNAGIWPEPTLPEHEAIAAEFMQPADAFATLVDEADVGPVLANILRQRMRPLRGKLPSTVATVSIFKMP
jgi:hypothetical protein